jgi:Endonuclease/Exonuclease/phosphatase family
MATPPQTRPETWVPAGAERAGALAPQGAATPEGPAARRPSVPRPPKEAHEPSPKRPSAIRTQLLGLRWTALGVALPWIWFLIRDLGPAMQLVAFALPLIVAASLLGLVVAAFDGKRISTVLVALSVALFGWVTVIGPRSAQPSPVPRDAVRVGTITADDGPLDAETLAAAVTRSRADVLVLATTSKRTRQAAATLKGYRARIVRVPFVVLSRFPLQELPLPKGIAKTTAIRVRIGRPDGPFVVYGVSSGAAPIEAALDAPVDVDRLRQAITEEQLPVVVLGDLGITDRSTQYRDLIEVMRDALRAGRSAQSTLISPVWTPLLLRVDQILTVPTWCGRGGARFEVPGSDHAGLSVSVGACPGRG